MRLHSDHAEHRPADPDLAAAGRAPLVEIPFSHEDRDESYRVQLVTKAALTGPEGVQTARVVWHSFVAAVAQQETDAFEQQGLLKALFSIQPEALMDEIAAGDENATQEMVGLVRAAASVDGNPFEAIPHQTLLAS